MRFEFATATRIVFGCGVMAEIGPIAAELGGSALVVTGRSPQRAAPLLSELARHQVAAEVLAVEGEPTTEQAGEGAIRARAGKHDLVISIGGGGALDAGKAIAALATNPGEPLDYLEVVGKGLALQATPLPWVAIPTTAGTGSEVTRNAVLTSLEHGVKASMRSPRMLARVALVDPALTCSMPPEVTASTGLDALTQLVEPYVCLRANPMTDAICREGIGRVARSLRRAWQQGSDLEARTDMAMASVLGGIALANAGLGAAHGLAAVLGGMLRASHGVICARLLGPVVRANLAALEQRAADRGAIGRYDEVACMLTGSPEAKAEDGAAWIDAMCESLEIPRLSALGMRAERVAEVARRAAASSSMKPNPVQLSVSELSEILDRAM
ncbi:MAG: iron-containing alcohol dehydrogenase [Deltaproteobacteria bacterium]|nr:iron-containing alcohol dehydrogenase [Deltaproteobacteria bacterium]